MGVRRLAVANGSNIFQMLLVSDSSLYFSCLARSACLPKGLYNILYVEFEFAVSIQYISVVVGQIITKFGECVG